MSEGIKETKELVAWAVKLGNAIGYALEDGKLSLADAFKFVPVLTGASEALKGAKAVPSELKSLSEDEYKDLVNHVKAHFNVPQDEIEKYVELGFEIGVKIAELAMKFGAK